MNKLLKGVMLASLTALMVGCGNNASTTEEKTTEKTTETKKQETKKEETKKEETKKTTTTSTVDLSKYPLGTYCVAVEGMHSRTAATRNAAVVSESFQQGVALQIVEVKVGDDNPYSVWGKYTDPTTAWICIADETGNYLLTQADYAASGIITNASPVYDEQQGLGSGVDGSQQGLGSGVDGSQQGIGSGVDGSQQQGIGSGVDGSQQGIGSGVTFSSDIYVNRTYTVQVDVLNVRSEMSKYADIIDTLSYGDQIYIGETVREDDGDGSIWAWSDSVGGWVCIQQLGVAPYLTFA